MTDKRDGQVRTGWHRCCLVSAGARGQASRVLIRNRASSPPATAAISSSLSIAALSSSSSIASLLRCGGNRFARQQDLLKARPSSLEVRSGRQGATRPIQYGGQLAAEPVDRGTVGNDEPAHSLRVSLLALRAAWPIEEDPDLNLPCQPDPRPPGADVSRASHGRTGLPSGQREEMLLLGRTSSRRSVIEECGRR